MADVIVDIRAKDDTRRGVESVKRRLSGLASSAGSILGGLGLAGGVAAGVAAIRSGVDAAADFETALTNIEARTELTEEGLNAVRQQALDMGRDTQFSASQAADGMLELVTSGSSAEEAIATIPGVLNLAAAAGLGLGHAADGVTDVMAQFGLEVGDANTVVNAFTQAAGSSSATAADLIDAMKNGGAVASGFGLDVEQTAAAMAVLAENGLKGAEAGTALKSFFLNATRGTGEAEEALGSIAFALEKNRRGFEGTLGEFRTQLGRTGESAQIIENAFSFFDEDGSARDFNEVIREISVALGEMTDLEANTTLKQLAGSYGQVAARALVASGGIDAMQETMGEQRSAAEVAETQMDTLDARVASFGSSMETLAVKVLTPLIDNVLKPFTEFLTDGLNAFNAWLDTDDAQQAIAAVSAGLQFLWEVVSSLVTIVRNAVGLIVSIFQGDFAGAFDYAQAVVTAVIDYIKLVWGTGLDFVVHLIQNFVPTAIRVFIGFVNGIIGLLESAFRGILTFVQNILNTIIRSINDALNSLPDFVKDTVFNVTGGRIDIKKGVGLLQEIDVAGSFSLPRVGLPAGLAAPGAAPAALPAFALPQFSGSGGGNTYITVEASTLIGDPQSIATDINDLRRRGYIR